MAFEVLQEPATDLWSLLRAWRENWEFNPWFRTWGGGRMQHCNSHWRDWRTLSYSAAIRLMRSVTLGALWILRGLGQQDSSKVGSCLSSCFARNCWQA